LLAGDRPRDGLFFALPSLGFCRKLANYPKGRDRSAADL